MHRRLSDWPRLCKIGVKTVEPAIQTFEESMGGASKRMRGLNSAGLATVDIETKDVGGAI